MDNLIPYFAGLVDGEGTLLINKHIFHELPNRNIRHVAYIRINMCDCAPLTLAKSIWGGSIHFNKIHTKNQKWRDTFMWTITSKSAKKFLQDIYPYLIVKKPQADILFKFFETIDKRTTGGTRQWSKKNHYPISIIKEREILFEELKRQKKISVM